MTAKLERLAWDAYAARRRLYGAERFAVQAWEARDKAWAEWRAAEEALVAAAADEEVEA